MLKRNWRYNWLTRRGSRTGHFRSGKLKSAWELAVMLHVSVATFQSALHVIYTSVLTMSKTRLNLTFGGQKGCRHARMSELMWVRCFYLFVQFCHREAEKSTARRRTFVGEKFSRLSYFKDCLNINASKDICLVSSKICLPRI